METQDSLVDISSSGESSQLNQRYAAMQADVDIGVHTSAADLHKSSLPLFDESLASVAAPFDSDVPSSGNECAAEGNALLHVNAPNGESSNFVCSVTQVTVTSQSEAEFGDKMWSCAEEDAPVPSDIVSVARNGSNDEYAGKSQSESENVDFGMSLAMDDFGGEFDDAGETSAVNADERTSCAVELTVGIEQIENNSSPAEYIETKEIDRGTKSEAAHKSKKRQRQALSDGADYPDVPETENNGAARLDEAAAADECSETPDDAGEADKPSVGTTTRKRQRRQSEDKQGAKEKESTVELNINTRPRRSVIRKSVFELLQGEYRGSGGSRKHSLEGDGETETVSKKKKTPSKPSDKAKRQSASHPENIVNQERSANSLLSKRVGYTPDDFMTDENEADANRQKEDDDVPPVLRALNESGLDSKSVKLNVSSLASDTRIEMGVKNSFAAEFEAASAEALSSLRSNEVVPKSELDDLMAENRQLRARLKALETSSSSVKKFQIDLHGRKFSRIRSPNTASSSTIKFERKIFNKSDGQQNVLSSFSETKHESDTLKSNDEADEAWKSRVALLDRREHKLRELSIELDDRTTGLQVRESTLQRRERKLLELEKTLEYRERVLSRHELNIQKRELQLELVAGSHNGKDSNEEKPIEEASSGGDSSTFIAEYVKRLELRRQELERRQNFLQSEREKLTARERELECRERAAAAAKADDHSEGTDDDSSSEEEEEEEEEAQEEEDEEEAQEVTINVVQTAKSARKGSLKQLKKPSPVSKALLAAKKRLKEECSVTPIKKYATTKLTKGVKTVASLTHSAGKRATSSQKSGSKLITRLRKRSL